MVTAIIAAAAAILVAVLSGVLPTLGEKHQRKIALLEADLRGKLPEGSPAGNAIDDVLTVRTRFSGAEIVSRTDIGLSASISYQFIGRWLKICTLVEEGAELAMYDAVDDASLEGSLEGYA